MSGLFWVGVGLDCLLLVVLSLLALAAAPEAKPGYSRDVLVWMVVLPVVGIGVAAFVFLRAGSVMWRVLALLLVFAPWIVVVTAKVRDALDDVRYAGRFLRPGPMRELEDAVLRGDESRVAALGKSASVNRRGYAGMTLLVLALTDRTEARKRMGVVRELIAAGADVNLSSEYALPLELACSVGLDAVRMLVDAGADVNRQTRDGRPAYFAAIGLPVDRGVLPMLLQRGADRKAVDKRGRTATDVARANGDEDAVRLLTSP